MVVLVPSNEIPTTTNLASGGPNSFDEPGHERRACWRRPGTDRSQARSGARNGGGTGVMAGSEEVAEGLSRGGAHGAGIGTAPARGGLP
jgi:hypothetical protein